MMKRIKCIKASIIVGLLLMVLFVSVTPSISAQEQNLGLFKFEPNVNIEIIDAEKTIGIMPADPKGKVIEVNVLYQITGILAPVAIPRFENAGINAQIQVSIGSTPAYCNVFLYTQNIQVPIRNQFERGTTKIQLQVTFLEGAPLMAAVDIPLILKATVAPAFPYRVEDIERTFTIPVSAAYIPIIDVVPKQTFKEVSPGEIATFEIDLENKGNAETEFRFDLSEVPDGWTASIISQTKIASEALGGNSKKTVTLEVRPPYRFGWHDEEKQLVVNVQGFYYADTGSTNTSSKVIPVRMIVRNRGFSFQPGIEMLAVILVIFALVLLVLFARYKGFFSKK